MHGRSLRSAFAWMVSGDALARVAVLVTMVVAARGLGPEDFGLYVVMYAVALLAATLWDLGVSVVVSREVGADRVSVRSALVRGARLRVRAVPVWVLAFAGGTALVSLRTAPPEPLLLDFAVASLGAGTAVLATAALRGVKRFAAASASQAAGKWATAALSVLVLGMVESDRLIWLGGAFAAGEVVAAVLAILLILGRQDSDTVGLDARATTITLRESLPFAANAVMSTVYNRFDVVLVGALASVGVAGIYGAASRCQDALYLIPGALGAIALPMLAGAVASSGAQAAQPVIRYLWKLGLAVAIPITVAVIIAAPTLVPLVLGDRYEEAVGPLRVLALFLPLAVIQAPLLAGLAAIGEGRLTTLVILATLVSALALQLVLVPTFGATGAAAASLGRDLVATPLSLYLGWRYRIISMSRGYRLSDIVRNRYGGP